LGFRRSKSKPPIPGDEKGRLIRNPTEKRTCLRALSIKRGGHPQIGEKTKTVLVKGCGPGIGERRVPRKRVGFNGVGEPGEKVYSGWT